MLENTVKRCPNRTALAVKRNDEWVKWTYAEYQVRNIVNNLVEIYSTSTCNNYILKLL